MQHTSDMYTSQVDFGVKSHNLCLWCTSANPNLNRINWNKICLV